MHLAQWADGRFRSARRLEKLINIRDEVPSMKFYLKIANKISETVAKVRQNYDKP